MKLFYTRLKLFQTTVEAFLKTIKTFFVLFVFATTTSFFCCNRQPQKLHPVNNFATMTTAGCSGKLFFAGSDKLFCYNRCRFLLELARASRWAHGEVQREHNDRCCGRRPAPPEMRPSPPKLWPSSPELQARNHECNHGRTLLHPRR